jgi:vacuolar-type H+-ATPase subunit E/Vma4
MSISNRAEKHTRIRELREAIAQLETELQKEMETEQHAMIDRLEDHFNAVETKLSSLKAFWQALKQDLMSPKSH